MLWLNGKDLRARPLSGRKKTLQCVIRATGSVLSPVFSVDTRGRDLFGAAEQLDLEGIVAKRKADVCAPNKAWYKVSNRAYSQLEGGRGERSEILTSPRRLAAQLGKRGVGSG